MLAPKISTGKELTCGPSFGNEIPFGVKNLLRGFGKDVWVGNTPSFGKRTVCACKKKFSGMCDDVAWI
jgi:hypothetical protein